ncbi:MAG: aminotransferase class I/II-fold pyridoxal phosphate-dependent enzyme [Clostridiales bacterium]|nr:aminotransferase class I/II-fold pyridoxal phosphate-dependent enzyme [Clostridiales bacterium]
MRGVLVSEILKRSQLLRENMTLENLFNLCCSNEEAVAARYLEGDEERAITYREYKQKTYAVAAALRAAVGEGKKGGFIGIQADTCPEWFCYFWGVIAAGYNAVLMDFSLNDEMTDYILRQAGAVGLITRNPRVLKQDAVQITLKQLSQAQEAPASFRPSFGDQVALCTSGTTDTSRVFVYDAHAVCSQVLNSELLYKANSRIICDEPRRNLAFLPFHHVFGFMVCLQWLSFIGYENIYLKDRSPKTILETARRFEITHLLAVPLLANNVCVALNKKVAKEGKIKQVMFKAMRGFSLGLQSIAPGFGIDFARNVLFKSVVSQMLGTNVRCIILGGSHTPQEHMRTLSALGYYTVSGFGMTETAITSVETGMNVITRTSGSVGRPLSSAEYRVQSDGSKSNRGEMYIRGNTIHTGRLVEGKLLPPDLDEEGWYRTGDVVRLEKGNRMYVEGRAKDVIINESGENVYPDEIEDVFGALEGVEQFCVLGVAAKDKKAESKRSHLPHLPGKKKAAIYEDITLVLNVGQYYKDDAYIAELMAQVRKLNSTLPSLKRISRVLATPEKFQTANGIKVKRLALKKAIEENKLAYRDIDFNRKGESTEENKPIVQEEKTPSDLQMEEIKQKVRQVYAESLEVPADQIRDDAHFIDELGGDSLQVLGMSLKIEELFNVLIPTEEYGKCTTVNDLSSLLYARVRGNVAYENALPEQNEPVTPITRFEDSPEFQAFLKRQEALMGGGMENPYFVVHDSPLLDTSNMAGERVLNFGSYNYVGMSGREETKAAAKKAIDEFGTSASGSRLLAGEKSLHGELEKEIADWKHTETALVLVGGHSTNVTFVGNFCGRGDLIVYDAISHNSIEQGCRLSQATAKPFPHNDYNALESILRTQRHKFAKVLIVIEGAYSMDGDIAPVPEFVKLKKKYGCFLMVDEAHSACVIGKTGGGVDEYFGLAPDDIDIKMGTLSKGIGTCGGYLAGPRCIIDYMRYSLPGFVFSVGISPPLAAAALEAIRLVRSDPSIMERMARNIKCFVEEAHKRGFNTCLAGETAIIPVMVGKDEDAFLLSNMLRQKGVFVPPAVYPAVPKNKARLRFCVISEHQPEQIIEALDKLEECAKEAGIQLPS